MEVEAARVRVAGGQDRQGPPSGPSHRPYHRLRFSVLGQHRAFYVDLPVGGCEALYAVGPGDIAPSVHHGGSVPSAVIVGALTGLHVVALSCLVLSINLIHVVAFGSPVTVEGRTLPQLPTRSSRTEVLAAVTGGGRSHKLRSGDQVRVGRVQLERLKSSLRQAVASRLGVAQLVRG